MPATVAEMFAATARDAGEHPFVIAPARPERDWYPQGIQYSYRETLHEVERLRDLYAAAGYGHGHRVAMLLENRPEFLFHYLALNWLGISIVPINPDYRRDEVAYLLEHSEAELAVVVPHRVEDVKDAAAESAKPLPVVNAHAMPDPLPPPSMPAPSSGAPGLETECSLLYTSGTTGRPKGCLHSNFYTLNAGETYCRLGGLMAIRPGQDRFYNPLPLFHINHLNIMSTAVMQTANTLVLPERFSPTRWWQDVSTHDVTVVHYLGIVAPMLLNQAPSPLDRAHKVRVGIGAGIEPQLHGVFEERFGFPMVEVWGMTETGRITADCHEPRMIGTRAFGRPFPGFETRVVDDNDRDAPPGTPGELVVRHSAENPRHGFFSGYLKNDMATEEAWRGGWFHTGDVVRQDASGMLFFVDRKKHIIRRAGENIAAAEIEAVLQAHDAVAQVAVVPAPDELREEEVLACIVPMQGVTPDAALANALFEHCNARLAYFKAPGWVLFLDKLPTTGTQKVQKTQIFKPGKDPRQRPGIIDLRARKKRG